MSDGSSKDKATKAEVSRALLAEVVERMMSGEWITVDELRAIREEAKPDTWREK